MSINKANISQSKNISVVSIEGNWDETINAFRLKLAADAFASRRADFILVSGTYDPAEGGNPRACTEKLGKKNARILKNYYGIDAARIVPIFAFPFAFTYTTIEAYGNACAIGWLACGLRYIDQTSYVEFMPVTSGAHCGRVHALNKRACSALAQFNVSVTVLEFPNKIKDESADFIASEAAKLMQIHEDNGVIKTGIWQHGSEEWSMDNPVNMQAMIRSFFTEVFSRLDRQIARGFVEKAIAGTSSRPGRDALMQLVCLTSCDDSLTSTNLDEIVISCRRRFKSAFDEAAFRQMAEMIIGS